MTSALMKHQNVLDRLCDRNRKRTLEVSSGLDFSSNDFLGLANSPELKEAALQAIERGVNIGSGGSRLLRGNDPEFLALEDEAAKFFGTKNALYFGSGFSANLAIFATLPQQDDLIVFDKLIHASVHDGMKLSAANSQAFEHNDPNSADETIANWRSAGGSGRVWLAFESLYSMDGDIAKIDELIKVAEKHDAIVIIDEAHATGVFGPHGRGLASEYDGRDDVITLHTCGKGLGASGALVCSASVFTEFLINKARSFIYATAPSPLMAAVVRKALLLMQENPERQIELGKLIDHANTEVVRQCGFPASGTQIIPIVIGDNKQTMAVSKSLRSRGYDVRGIRPPTVPRGTSRLRIAITLNTSAEDVTALFEALGEELGKIAA